MPDESSKVVSVCESIARDIRSQYTLGYLSSAATQVAVISTVHNSGWQCSDNGVAQGGGAKFHGLLAVRLSAGVNHIGCTYTPPGLRRGLAIAAAAGLGLIAVAVWPLVVQFVGRRRRKALAA